MLMASEWTKVTADQVQPGDRVKLPSGEELTATRIEESFLGRAEMLALIEDTSERWYKRPLPISTEVEVSR